MWGRSRQDDIPPCQSTVATPESAVPVPSYGLLAWLMTRYATSVVLKFKACLELDRNIPRHTCGPTSSPDAPGTTREDPMAALEQGPALALFDEEVRAEFGDPARFSASVAASPRTLVDILDATVRAHPDEPALDDGHRVLTYRALAVE